jgi:hypothetical protein
MELSKRDESYLSSLVGRSPWSFLFRFGRDVEAECVPKISDFGTTNDLSQNGAFTLFLSPRF